MFQLFSVLCCIHVASVLRCSAGGESGAVRTRALGAGRLGCCGSERAGGVLALSRSSRLPSVARAEREEGIRGKTTGRRDRDGVHSWGGAKADGTRHTCPSRRPDASHVLMIIVVDTLELSDEIGLTGT
jgi:hypothetical protein